MPDSLRYNVEVADPEEGDRTVNWQTKAQVIRLLGQMEEGGALVINAVAGPGKDEL